LYARARQIEMKQERVPGDLRIEIRRAEQTVRDELEEIEQGPARLERLTRQCREDLWAMRHLQALEAVGRQGPWQLQGIAVAPCGETRDCERTWSRHLDALHGLGELVFSESNLVAVGLASDADTTALVLSRAYDGVARESRISLDLVCGTPDCGGIDPQALGQDLRQRGAAGGP
jgi:hypothetical protein